MRKLKIVSLVMLCILTAGLCGIFAYGMTGHNIYAGSHVYGVDNHGYNSQRLVLEKEVPLDGIDSISVQYDMNNNDIYIYESEGNSLTVKEYNELELTENEVSTVRVTGSSLEIKGKKRNGRNYVGFGFFNVHTAYGYTEIGLPSSYNGELIFDTSSGDIVSQMDIALEKDFHAAASSGSISIPDVNAQNASLSCSSGDVRVETVRTDRNGSVGEINISTSSGNINVKQLAGKITIGSSSGDINVNELTGETHIKSSSGYVKSETISGNTQISTSSGDIMVQQIEGDATVEASSGYVRIYKGSGQRTVKTTSGDILLEEVDSEWNLNTSSGDVCVKASKGNGGVHTSSGDINLEPGQLTGNIDISSTSGYVKMKLSKDSAFDFEANTTSGDINTFFDDELSFSKKGNNAHGTYGKNTDGIRIQIETTSGDVRVMD